jgi:hypothetical protein
MSGPNTQYDPVEVATLEPAALERAVSDALGAIAVTYVEWAGYGYQQSLGCVELPYKTAQFIWPYLTYGTLVTVTPQ